MTNIRDIAKLAGVSVMCHYIADFFDWKRVSYFITELYRLCSNLWILFKCYDSE
ncbi:MULTISPECIES: hypothetical protein [Bacillus]|uniref:hypothetical protein n=1 Tax=Bacillus TaxID=1386 RepID=UPI00032DFC62|nr:MULTISPECIES: hypothetical protein [Bacillus cereus group]EOP61811.1 hypothetical protein IIW_05046 [Bacillus cereus VD136]EOP76807.1 hypothetical protein KOW_05002 [Bacillus cereus VDM006]EOQ17928.1 hypothetical protein KOY_04695 [Bacillus cereus VDM021]MDF2084229.1 hypothetical protein [Bacillus pseudomycoides]